MKQGLMTRFSGISSAARGFVRIANAGSRIAYCALIVSCIFLFAGFIRFATIVAQYDNSVEPSGEAIVVLTGDNFRIETGLDLLQRGRGKEMLISGVYPETREKVLLSRYTRYKDLFSCCIEIDRIAQNTTQNGLETAKWMRKKGYQSLIVVTSDYHMPRSLMELSKAMPDTLLFPYVAMNSKRPNTAAISNSDHLRIMVREFMKTIASSLGAKR